MSLRCNQVIKGFPVREFTNLIGQYADDADMYLLYDQDSHTEVMKLIQSFQEVSGFTVSYDKTQIYRIGSLVNSDAELYTQNSIKWTNQPINVLGVWIHHDLQTVMELNYNPIIDKAANIF